MHDAATTAREALLAVTETLPGPPRSAQIEMVERIADAIDHQRSLSICAPTGTGKSFGYLVPVVLSEKKTVVITATKALQDQLDRKDLPFLAQQLDHDVSWAVLKGRSNYACRAKIDDLHHQLRIGVDTERAQALLDWVDETTTGDQAECDVDGAVWASMSMTSDECPGAQRCTFGADCFYEAARERAANVNVIVTNTAMYGAHIAAEGAVLPEHDVIVIDEAHGAEDSLRGALSLAVDAVRLRQFASRVTNEKGVANDVDRLRDAAQALDDALVARGDGWIRKGPASDPAIASALTNAATATTAIRSALDRAVAALPKGSDADTEERNRVERLRMIAQSTESDLSRLHAWAEGDVCWIASDRGRIQLHLAPLDIARILHSAVWSDGATAIITSATLDARTGARLGLRDYEAMELPSPFDHRAQAMLYVPTVAAPNAASFRAEADAEIVRLIEAAGGRTLALFTSYQAMRDSATAVAGAVDVPVLVQGEGSKAALLEQFLADEATCLFATMSFWQGIDPSGTTCAVVIIDKLPFARPDDPVVSAQRDAARAEAFVTVDIPRAATLLAQGAGRLIRSEDDWGVVAVLDSRLAEKSYRTHFLRALPPMKRTRTFEEVEAFLTARLTAGGSGEATPEPIS